MLPDSKLCRGCDRVLGLARFAKDRTASDGLQGRCRECKAARAREHYAANREYWRERYASDPGAYAARREARRERLRESGQLSALDAAANRRQRDKLRENGTLEDFDRRRHNARRAREATSPVRGSIDIRGRTCDYCGVPATCVDHVVPLARGGSNDASNLVPACTTCNSSKRDRLPEEWPQNPQRRRRVGS